MHDRNTKSRHNQEIDVYYKKRQNRPQGNINADIRTFHGTAQELVVLMSMIVADIMDQFVGLMVCSDDNLTSSQCYLLVGEAMDKLINEKYGDYVRMSKDEKAEFMQKFVEARNKMQK